MAAVVVVLDFKFHLFTDKNEVISGKVFFNYLVEASTLYSGLPLTFL